MIQEKHLYTYMRQECKECDRWGTDDHLMTTRFIGLSCSYGCNCYRECQNNKWGARVPWVTHI